MGNSGWFNRLGSLDTGFCREFADADPGWPGWR